METINEYTDLIYRLKYICIDDLVRQTILDAEGFKIDYCLSDRNFKYVKKNIVFHFLFLNTLQLLKTHVPGNPFKPALFTSKQLEIDDEVIEAQLKLLKRLLPVPVILSLDDYLTFRGKLGPLKEMNSRVLNFYQNRKVKLKNLKKYFNEKGFNTLANTLSSVVDLKGFYY